jgi:4-hydroxy-2-oxoheptanedioate aldolase
MPRINRAIDRLVEGAVLFYTDPGDLTYENGRRQAETWADFLLVDFEHAPFDVVGLTAFMRGLVDGGPTPDDYRTPPVITTLPSNCRTVAEVRANAWQVRQVLTAGVHGILHTHARRADAVAAFVEECRYPTQGLRTRDGRPGARHEVSSDQSPVPDLQSLGPGQRGAGGQQRAAAIWGVPAAEYVRLADPWPLNVDGALLLGVKIEDRECLAHAREVAAVPGLAFAEWGPGDMGISFGYADAHDPPYPPELEAARLAIKAACDEHGLMFLSSWNDRRRTIEENVRFLLDWGVRIISPGAAGPAGEEWARAGRRIAGERSAN